MTKGRKPTTKSKARPNGCAPLDVSARKLKVLVDKHRAARKRLIRLNAVAEKKIKAEGIGVPPHFDRAVHFKRLAELAANICVQPISRAREKKILSFVKKQTDEIEAGNKRWHRDYLAATKRIHAAVGASAALDHCNDLYAQCSKAAKAFFGARARTVADVKAKAQLLTDLYSEWFAEFDGETWTGYIARDLAKLEPTKA